MVFYKRYSVLFGLFALVCVIALLFSTPDSLFSRGVSFIDSELNRSSGNEAYVITKMNLGSQEHVSAFPTEIGEWKGYDYDATRVSEDLGADVVLLRGYDRPGLYQPIFFLIMQAKTSSSFHPPPICYPALGYEIEEEGREQVLVTDTSWTEATSSSSIWIPMKKLVVFKESDGEVQERRVVLYCYLKGNMVTSDTVNMIRVSALAPIDGSYEGILEVLKDFTAQSIPYMFEFRQEENRQTIAAILAEFGVGGYFAIALLLFTPVAIIAYPRIRGRPGSAKRPTAMKPSIRGRPGSAKKSKRIK